MAISPTCRICSGPGDYFCTWCESSFFCKHHVCAHIGKDMLETEQAAKPKPALTPELKAVLIVVVVLIVAAFIWAHGGDGTPQP